MNVWIMNLIDNRADADEASIRKKFELCKMLGILAIGWTGWSTDESTAYQKADNGLTRLSDSDLVWTKHPITKEQYLCVITGGKTAENGILTKFDVNEIVPCEYIRVSDDLLLKYGLDKNKIYNQSTIVQCRIQSIVDATKKLYSSII